MNKVSLVVLSIISSLSILSGCDSLANQKTNSDTNLNSNIQVSETNGSIDIKGEVWVDNWFSLALNGKDLVEDSVSINTERSFNSETFDFKADYPFVLAMTLKDFKENDTGLEYIGARNQQMGDGGAIAQFTNINTGNKIAVTDENWKCMVIHTAPLDKSCESEENPSSDSAPCTFSSQPEPEGWKNTDFDDTNWNSATVHSESSVSPKDGYNSISWDDSAKFIWGEDLETNNTVLCRFKVEAP